MRSFLKIIEDLARPKVNFQFYSDFHRILKWLDKEASGGASKFWMLLRVIYTHTHNIVCIGVSEKIRDLFAEVPEASVFPGVLFAFECWACIPFVISR